MQRNETSTVLAGAQVMVVEDNDINLEIAVALLQDAGASTTVANGQEALHSFPGLGGFII
ncbi:MAG: hypothetical protein ACLUOI_26500 [Eisenbergiella sp.]